VYHVCRLTAKTLFDVCLDSLPHVGNWQCAVKAKGVWLLLGALAVVRYGISLIHSSILSVGVWSFHFSIGNSCLLADSDPSFLSFSMLWLNESFFAYAESFWPSYLTPVELFGSCEARDVKREVLPYYAKIQDLRKSKLYYK